MLVIQRKPSQVLKLTIPPSTVEREITITVVRLTTINCRMGIDADKDVIILRDDAKRKVKE